MHFDQNDFFPQFCYDINQRKNTSPFDFFKFCFFQPYLLHSYLGQSQVTFIIRVSHFIKSFSSVIESIQITLEFSINWGYRWELYLTGPLNLEVHHIIDVNLFTILQSFKICASGFLMYPSPLTRPPLPKELMVVLHDGGSSELLPNSDENKDA